ncbi:hypothetical protein ccbrp13_32960 [Ktedonobacteria bacterium brp13]|nr:hypothetical protein ccbrp13_32960 [Ktedonobacteria bacterium brp13]
MSDITRRIADLSPEKRALLLRQLKQQKEGVTSTQERIHPQKRDSNTFPMSFAQQRLWFLHQLEPESTAYLVSGLKRLAGTLDTIALARSLDMLIQRHEILRTTFSSRAGQPLQIIHPTGFIHLPLFDLQSLSWTEQLGVMKRLVAQDGQYPCDLTKGPLLRVALIRLGSQEHALLVTMHHIISDGWSGEVFMRELMILYHAFASGLPITESSPLAPLPIQYADFAVWQREWLQGEVLAQQLDYWKQQLDAIVPLELPADHPRPAVQTFQGVFQSVRLSTSLLDRLLELCRREDVTLFILLLAAFQVLLARYTGQTDISVGTPIANRSRSELEELMGFFVNTLVLRTDLSGNPSFLEVLQRARNVSLAAYAHQDVPFEQLVEALQPERDLSRSPLFQVSFSVVQREDRAIAPETAETLAFTEWEDAHLENEVTTTKFDLTFVAVRRGKEFHCGVEYKSDIFEPATIEHLLGHWQTLLEAIAADPTTSLVDLPLLTPAERRLVLEEWNDTFLPVPSVHCIQKLIEQQVLSTPDALAVVYEDQQLTYAALNRRANQLAHFLRKRGIGPECMVGVCMERSLELLIGIVGALKAGAAYVPLDPALPTERLAALLETLALPILLTQESFREQNPGIGVDIFCLDSDWGALDAEDSSNPSHSTDEFSLAYVIHTSGSTGKPKGVQVTQKNLIHSTLARLTCYREPVGAYLLLSPFSFDSSVAGIFWTLCCGGRLVLPQEHFQYDLAQLPHLIERQAISHMLSIPSLYLFLLDQAYEDQLASLRTVIVAGEACSIALVQRHRETLPATSLYNEYGPTEGTVWSSVYRDDGQSLLEPVPIGRPIANVHLYLLDAALRPVPIGIAGELYIGGAGVVRGYLNDAAGTAERFIPHPFSALPGERLYRTGDLARYTSGGMIEFLGRSDQQVKVRGYRIELGEIEAVLDQCPGVQESVVLALEDETRQKQLVAYVVQSALSDDEQEPDTVLTTEHIQLFQNLYDNLYAQEQAFSDQDNAINTSVWTSSYTNRPLLEEEVLESVEDTVSRILKLRLRRVLEIGCGTGLLLFRIAPHCEQYSGIDLSEVALGRLRGRVALQQPELAHVKLHHGAAHEIAEIVAPMETFDTVIINEVIQHFPDLHYLEQVLASVARVMRPGGTIFLGGLRSLSLLKTFHASIQLYRASPSLPLVQLRQQLQKHQLLEKDLVIDAEFFATLHQRVPQLSLAQVQLKGGRYQNEMTRFKYDVILRVGGDARQNQEIPWLDWRERALSIAQLRTYLQEQRPEYIGIRHIPNARLQSDTHATLLLERENADITTVSDIRAAIEERANESGVEPEDLWELGRSLAYNVEIRWPYDRGGADGDLIAVLRRQDAGELGEAGLLLAPGEARAIKSRLIYANNPLRGQHVQEQGAQLREYIQQRLPEYMVPARFVILEALPRTPHGKVDRRALSQLHTLDAEVVRSSVAPRTFVEELLVEIWCEILKRPVVSIHSNFFELGGHSLLATQLMARIRSVLLVEIPLRCLFEDPTIAGLAQRVEQELRGGASQTIPPLVPGERSDNIPLSFAQRRLWFLNRLNPDSTAYTIPSAQRLHGAMDMRGLEQSLSAIVQRHEVLRTTFVEHGEEPAQIIHRAGPFHLPIIDLGALSEEVREAEARRLTAQDFQRPFDLIEGPLLRSFLLALGKDEHVLLLSMHHIVSDGWSHSVLQRELIVFYRSFTTGQTSQPAALPIQYADFALWQRSWLQGEVLEAQLEYWRQQLDGAVPLELPLDHPRPTIQTFRGAYLTRTLPLSLHEQLVALGKQLGVTQFMLLLAAFSVLLARYSGQNDISIGTPSANRTHAELEGLIGFFINMLVLRMDLTENPSFLDLLARVREVTLGAYAHQDVPFEYLVERLQPQRDLSRHPFFQVLFGVQQASLETQTLDDLTLQDFVVDHTITKFDITFNIVSTEQGLQCGVEYSTGLFEEETIQRLLEHWQVLLEGIVADPAQPLSRLPLLPPHEQTLLLRQWSGEPHEPVEPRLFCDLFAEQVQRHPDALALVDEQHTLSYAALDRWASALAHLLREQGVGPEVVVGVQVERSVTWLIALLGILKAGGGYLPLDEKLPENRLRHILREAGVHLLVTLSGEQPDWVPADLPVLDVSSCWSILARQTCPLGWRVAVEAENLAYVIYTSGSTGTPKGVQIAHRGLGNLARAQSQLFAVEAHSHVLQYASQSFDASLAEVLVSLLSGASLYLASQPRLLPGASLTEVVERWGITVGTLPPSVLRWQPAGTLSSLQTLVVAGEACPADLGVRWGEGRRFCNAYGPSEVTVCATVGVKAADGAMPPIGKALSGQRVYVLDEQQQVVPVGTAGELYVGGIGEGRGYVGRAAETAERFVPDPFGQQAGGRLYRTGDRVRYRGDGNLEYLGRKDQQVKVRGYRVELGEIEAVLREREGVWEAVVVVSESELGEVRLVGFVVEEEEGASGTWSEVRGWLQERLPDYMVPTHLVRLKELPLTRSGKIDRQALGRWTPKEEREGGEGVWELGEEYTPLEEVVSGIWQEVLELEGEAIGKDENFFELGGHSLLATRVMTRVQKILQVDILLQSLFEAPTIAGLAQRIEQALRGELRRDLPKLKKVSRMEPIPLSFAQQRLWFFDQLEPGSAAYLVPNALRLSGALNAFVLERCMKELIGRHESLRTTFGTWEDQPVQIIHPVAAFCLPFIDLRGLPRQQREAEIHRLAQQEAQRPFDLAQGPLLRVLLLRSTALEHVLLLTMHHIVSDGWSAGIFQRELTALYRAFIAGLPSPLLPLAIQYADFAYWQRSWLQGEVLETQLNYWKRQLADIPALELPTDHPRPPVQTFNGAIEAISLPVALYEELVALSRQEHITFFMLLLAAFQVLLARYTGQSDISVGTPIANRTRNELEGLIGFFVNTLVMRCDLSGNPTFVGLLARVRRVALDAFAHQDVPFEQLVDIVQPERDLSRSPLFSIMFSVQQAPTPGEEIQGLTFQGLGMENPSAKFDLTFTILSDPRGLRCGLEYNRDLFEASTIRRLLGHWHTLLKNIVSSPQARLSEFSLLTEADYHRVVKEWNETQRSYPRERLSTLVEAQAIRTPERIAIQDEEGSLSYAALNRLSSQFAHLLRQQGVQERMPVAVCLPRSLEGAIAVLGILKAGNVYVPLDPTAPVERVQSLLQQMQAAVLVTLGAPSLQGLGVPVLSIPACWADLLAASWEPVSSTVQAQETAYIMYTSGSTGRPKGVMVSHQAIVNRLCWGLEDVCLCSEDRVAQLASWSFDIALWELLGPWLVGACSVLLSNDQVKDSALLIQRVQQEAITILHLVPSLLHALLQDAAFGQCGSVRSLQCGGEAVSVELVRRAFAELGVEVHQFYGPTEAAISVTGWTGKSQQQIEHLSLGRPIANTQLYLVDRSWELVPPGMRGEIWIGGEAVAQGYLQQPEQTAERFVPDPYSGKAGARVYRTGDEGRYRSNGELEFVGRRDSQVKLRGYRVEPGEIEALLQEHPAVGDTVVTVQNDAAGRPRLVAFVVPRERETQIESDILRDYLQAKLPAYMVPSAFIVLAELPLTQNGKVDRDALLRLYDSSMLPTQSFVAPHTDNERTLASIWTSVLGSKQVGIHDNFFALGGDSILSIQVIARARQVGLHLTTKQLFQYQTIAQLAAQAQTGKISETDQAPLTGSVLLSPIQRWFFAQDLPERHHYNQALLLEMQQRLRSDWLLQAIRHLLRQHDALRLRFVQDAAGWRQEYAEPPATPPFIHIDLSALSTELQKITLERLAEAAQKSLDQALSPLLRCLVFDNGEEHPGNLLFIAHHLIIDSVSWRILLTDLETAYLQLSRNEAIALPAKTTSFQQWTADLQQAAQSTTFYQEQSYWLSAQRMQEQPLHVDMPGGDNTLASSEQIVVALSEEETRALLQQVPTVYQTQVNDILLTAVALTFASWTQHNLLLVDLEGHGREEIFENVDLSRTVGWFSTQYPVLLDTRQALDPGSAIKAIKEQLRQVPQHGIGYGVLRYMSNDPAISEQFADLPQAQVSFNYLGQFDPLFAGLSLLRPAHASSGSPFSQKGQRSYLFMLNGAIIDGRLRMVWQYSRQMHKPETVQRLAQRFLTELQNLIAHCQTSEAGGYTPSDFPLVPLTQPILDQLVQEVRAGGLAIEDIYPLSPMQAGLLFHSLYEQDAGVYFEQLNWTIRGDLNVSAWRRAWQRVIDQHAVLRTRFYWQESLKPFQIVYRHVELPWNYYDWRGLPVSEQQARLAMLLSELRQQGFDLQVTPLLRLTLIRLDEDTYTFVENIHHILMDGWSQPLLFQEVLTSYRAYCQEQEPRLVSPRPYRDYIAWLQQQETTQTERFWREYLAGFTRPTLLSVDWRVGIQSISSYEKMGGAQFILTDEMAGTLQNFAQQHQLTVNTIVQGAWALTLAHYSGEDAVVFGSIVAGRPAELPGVESMIGLFINTLPVHIRIESERAAIDWLAQLQKQHIELQQYSYTPLVEIQRLSEVPAKQSLFEYALGFQNYPADLSSARDQLSKLDIQAVPGIEHSNYPLMLKVVIGGAHSFLELSYDKTRFEHATIEALLAHLHLQLTALMNQYQQPLAQLPRLTEADRHRVVKEWNETQRSYPRERLSTLVEAQAIRTPECIAIQDEEGSLSYAALNRLSSQFAHLLRQQGVQERMPVAVCLPRSLEGAIAVLGILKAGNVYVPLDPTAPVERVQSLLQQTQAAVLVTLGAPSLQGLGVPVLSIPACWADLLTASWEPVSSTVQAQETAYIMYTSGSTGRPKGVMVSHQAIVNRLCWGLEDVCLCSEDRVAQLASWSFDIALWELLGPWLVGACSVLLSNDQVKDSALLIQRVQQEAITILHLVPSLLHALLQDAAFGQCGSVRSLQCGGEAVSVELVRRAFAELGVEVHQFYGPTEAAISVTGWTGKSQQQIEHLSLGRPIANTQLYLVDRSWELVPPGMRGEIWIGGEAVAQGYLQQPEQTAERFVPDPYSGKAGARVYRTGDEGRYRSNGELEFVGRRDGQVKLRGYRVEPGEIEALLQQHPIVDDCIVQVDESNKGDQRLVAYIIGAKSAVSSTEELRTYLQARLPEYMVPTFFMFLEVWPLTVNSKVDRQALPAPVSERQPTSESNLQTALRSPIEELLAEMWCELLGCSFVAGDDDFFMLGGHSILATQFVSRVRAVLHIEMPLHKFFRNSKLVDFTRLVEQALRGEQEEDALPLLPVPRTAEPLPLSFAQQRLWFIDQMVSDRTTYLVPGARRLEGPLKLSAFAHSVDALVQRHESLRTTFSVQVSEPVQIIHPARPLRLPVIDLSALAQDIREAEARRLVEKEVQNPCDLQQGPLFRVSLIRLNHTMHIFITVLHHIITDGWSDDILFRELTTLYRAFVNGEPSPLPPLTVQYADFAVWQRNSLQGEVLQRHLDYWKRQLEGATPLLLPADYPRQAMQCYRGAASFFMLPSDLSQQLIAFSRQEGVTLFMSLLAAFQTVLCRISRQTDVVVGTDIANRTHKDTEGLIGFFVNLLALRMDFSGSPRLRSVLRRVREVVLGAYAHQDIPFEMIVEHLKLERSVNRTPLIQVLFVLQNTPHTSQEVADIVVKPVGSETSTVKFDIALFVHEHPDGIAVAINYSTDLFKESTIAALMQRFELVIRTLVTSPDTSVDAVEILTAEEKQEQVRAEAALQSASNKGLRASKGEAIDLSKLGTWQFGQKKR